MPRDPASAKLKLKNREAELPEMELESTGHTSRNTDLILRVIGKRFTHMIERDRVKALRNLQKDLMDNLAPLSYRTPIKEVITKALEIEDLLKSSTGNTGRSPLEETRDFLTAPSKLEAESETDLKHKVQ